MQNMNLKRVLILTTVGVLSFGVTACSGEKNDDVVTEVTTDIKDKAITATSKAKTEIELAAERTAAELKEQSEKVVDTAQASAERLETAGNVTLAATERNIARLKAEGKITAAEAEIMLESAKAEAADLKKTAGEVMERAETKADAMKQAGKDIVKDVKDK